MSNNNDRKKRWGSGRFWGLVLVGPALLAMGCASAPEAQVTPEDIAAVEKRVQDMERTNGRLLVRLEEMERQMALVQDRVDSNRIALQRHGYLGQRSRGVAIRPQQQGADEERPDRAPESHYRSGSDDYSANPSMQQRMDRRGGRRIQLGSEEEDGDDAPRYVGQDSSQALAQGADPAGGDLQYQPDGSGDDRASDEDTLVITNAELEARYGTTPSRSSSSSSSSETPASEESSSSSSSSGHAPVTDERLPTSQELGSDSDGDASGSVDQAPTQELDSEDDILDRYQDALAKYRAGDYAAALVGFESVLAAGPPASYVDNALYWIGECHYGLGDYDTSVEYFTQIIEEMPQANKVPDAMLKMSLAYDRLGQPRDAVELLEELVAGFPNSNPGQLGQERLEEHPAVD